MLNFSIHSFYYADPWFWIQGFSTVVCVCARLARGSQKRVLDSLELDV